MCISVTDDNTARPVDVYQPQSGHRLPTHQPTVRPSHATRTSRSGQTEHVVRYLNSMQIKNKSYRPVMPHLQCSL